MKFPLVNVFVPSQVALSASAIAVAQIFNLISAAAITTAALQAIAAVTVASLALDLVGEVGGWQLKNYVPFMPPYPHIDDYRFSLNALSKMVLTSTLGLFALGFVAAPVAQGMLCYVSRAASLEGLDSLLSVANRVKARVLSITSQVSEESGTQDGVSIE